MTIFRRHELLNFLSILTIRDHGNVVTKMKISKILVVHFNEVDVCSQIFHKGTINQNGIIFFQKYEQSINVVIRNYK